MTKQADPPTYLFVIPWSITHLGGVNQVVINLAREMMRSGIFDPVILIVDWDAVTPIWQVVHGLRTVRWRVRPYRAGMGMKEQIAFHLWMWRFRPRFHKFCVEHRVASINSHYPDLTTLTLSFIVQKLDPDIPLILSFHGADLSAVHALQGNEMAHWQQLLLCARAIVVCSSDLGKKVTEVFGAQHVPQVIHNGLDALAFTTLANKQAFTANRSILNVAKFEKKKGQDILVRAFAEIADEFTDIHLIFVGANDKALPALRDLCNSKGLNERVHFHPDTPHDQVANFFCQATIFVLPSRQEPFGIVLLEAGAFALPVIATRIGGIPEILMDGITGLLVSPDNETELAACLRSLLNSPSTAREMGARLKSHVISNFTWTHAHNKYVALLK